MSTFGLDYLNNYRSKTRILNYDGSNGPFCIERIPIWNFDGSSTQQADGEDSEVYIKPVYMVRDPFRRGKDSWLVLCDTWLPDGEPHPDNTRVTAMKVFSQQPVIDSETWFGLEQEFFITKMGLTNGDGPFYIKRFANQKYTRALLLWSRHGKLSLQRIYG